MKASALNESIQKIADFIEQWIKPIFQFLIRLRVQTTIALVTYLILTKVEQAIEVYRSIALDSNLYQAAIATLSVSALTVFVWYTSRFLVLEQCDTDEQNQCQSFLSNWRPRLLGIVPILGLSFGILEAWKQSINEGVRAFLMIWMILSLGSAIILFLLFVYRTGERVTF